MWHIFIFAALFALTHVSAVDLSPSSGTQGSVGGVLRGTAAVSSQPGALAGFLGKKPENLPTLHSHVDTHLVELVKHGHDLAAHGAKLAAHGESLASSLRRPHIAHGESAASSVHYPKPNYDFMFQSNYDLQNPSDFDDTDDEDAKSPKAAQMISTTSAPPGRNIGLTYGINNPSNFDDDDNVARGAFISDLGVNSIQGENKSLGENADSATMAPSGEVSAQSSSFEEIRTLRIPATLNLGRMIKPHIHDSVKPQLAAFEYFVPTESCSVIVDELLSDADRTAAGISLHNTLAAINYDGYDTLEEKAIADKTAAVAFNILWAHVIEPGVHAHDSSGADLLSRLIRISMCEADAKTGRTIYQKLIEKGMLQCLKTDFARGLLSQDRETDRGDTVFSPHLTLDNEGNTLLHLAALSGSQNVYDLVIQLERVRSQESGTTSLKPMFWELAALEHANKDGKKPIDLAPTAGFQRHLKSIFRNLSGFITNMINRGEGHRVVKSL